MKLKQLLVVFPLLFMISFPAHAGDNPEIVGVYTKVPGHEFVFDGKTVEIVEFLSFYCGHCFQFEKSIPVIKGNFPKKIKWKIVPIYWGKGSPKPGEAYLLAVDAGKGEQMKKALFESVFLERKNIGKIEVLEAIGAKMDLGFEFSMKLRSGDKSKDVEEALEMAKSYKINETPSLIIAGNLKTTPGMLKGNMDLMRDNTILILNGLFK